MADNVLPWSIFKQITEPVSAAQLIPYKNETFDKPFVRSLLSTESIDALNFMVIHEKPIIVGFKTMIRLISEDKYRSVMFLLTETGYLNGLSPHDFKYHFGNVKNVEVLRTIFKNTGWLMNDIHDLVRSFIIGQKANIVFVKFAVEELGLTKEKIMENIEFYVIQSPLDVLIYLRGFCDFNQGSLIEGLKNYYEEGMNAEYYYLRESLDNDNEIDLGVNISLREDTSIEFIKEVCQNPVILDNFQKGCAWNSFTFLKKISFEIFQFAWENEFYDLMHDKCLTYQLGLFRRVDLFKYVMQFCGHNLDNALNFVRGLLGITIDQNIPGIYIKINIDKIVYLDIIAEIFAEYNIGMNELDRAIENKLWSCAPEHIIDALPLDANRIRHNNCVILKFAIQGDNMYAVQKILAVSDVNFRSVLRKMRPYNLTHTMAQIIAHV